MARSWRRFGERNAGADQWGSPSSSLVSSSLRSTCVLIQQFDLATNG